MNIAPRRKFIHMIRPRQDFWALIYVTTPNLAENPPTTFFYKYTKTIDFCSIYTTCITRKTEAWIPTHLIFLEVNKCENDFERKSTQWRRIQLKIRQINHFLSSKLDPTQGPGQTSAHVSYNSSGLTSLSSPLSAPVLPPFLWPDDVINPVKAPVPSIKKTP